MAKTVTIPGVGKVPTKWAVAGGVAIVVIAGVAWWRYSTAKSAIEEDPGTVVNDYAAVGDETVYPAYSTDYAPDQSYDGGAYPYPTYTTPSYGLTSTVQTPDPITNSEWVRRGIEHLEAVGAESMTASLSLSRYLLKECVTAPQGDLVRQAIGALGPPPQGTFTIITCPSGNPGDGNPPPTGGEPDDEGSGPPAQVTGLKVAGTGRTWITLDWPHAARAHGYTVFKDGRRHTSVLYSKYTAQGLKPNTSYSFDVVSVGGDGVERGPAARITARTKR